LGSMLALIFLEPDWGTTLLLASVGVGLLYLGGTRLRYLLPAMLLGAAGVGFLLRHNPVRMGRMMAFLDLETYKDSVGYQTWQAMLALGAGGWDGLGLGNGRQKLGFVPENQTDFILSVVGEELGVVATLAVVVAFLLFTVCGFYISSRCKNLFGFLLGTGITMLVSLQAFINIGVVTSILPNKGLPLPFVSYGGSNLVVMLAGVGLLIGLARQTEEEEGRGAAASEEHDMPEENRMISMEKASSLPY
jgi:cell division protein FtsW